MQLLQVLVQMVPVLWDILVARLNSPHLDITNLVPSSEIQDIIKDQKPEIIHDKEAAINYFAFTNKDSKKKRSDDGNDFGKRADEKDQWVSFDDKKTMKQKVDWANDLG